MADTPSPVPSFDVAAVRAEIAEVRAMLGPVTKSWALDNLDAALDWIEADAKDAERWRAVRQTLHASSIGVRGGYYMTTGECSDNGGQMPSADRYADLVIARFAATTPTTGAET